MTDEEILSVFNDLSDRAIYNLFHNILENRKFEYDSAVDESNGSRPTDIAKLAVIKHIICN